MDSIQDILKAAQPSWMKDGLGIRGQQPDRSDYITEMDGADGGLGAMQVRPPRTPIDAASNDPVTGPVGAAGIAGATGPLTPGPEGVTTGPSGPQGPSGVGTITGPQGPIGPQGWGGSIETIFYLDGGGAPATITVVKS